MNAARIPELRTPAGRQRRSIVAIVGLAATLLSVAALPCQERGQDDKLFRHVGFRVTATGPGATITVDRGKSDKLERGDLVLVHPLKGGTYRGVVLRVRDRSATVELHDKTFLPPLGTRGEVLVPRQRFAAAPAPPSDPVPPTGEAPAGPPPQQGDPKKPDWQNKDEAYRQGAPLLSGLRPLHPAERAPRVSGRTFVISEVTLDREDSLDNSFFRVGTDLDYENPFGKGGGLRFDTEIDYRTEQNESRGFDLLPRRLSYHQGGTRFSPSRWEVGRFLQAGVPELHVLDGIEWGRRRENGHRYGFSLGFLPEPDDDFESGKDFQAAAYYDYVAGEREQLTVSGALQKTFHHGKADRDLLLAKVRYLPDDGWDLHATVWVDYYYGRDDVKGGGFEVTQAVASLGRRFANGNGIDLTYRRFRYPEMLRDEFPPVLVDRLDDAQYDRLNLSTWMLLSADTRWNAKVGAWVDEDDEGGAFDTGLECADLFGKDSRTHLAAFGTLGSFTSNAGGRLAYGRDTDDGRWDLLYELTYVHHRGYPADRDDLLQHRFRGSRNYHWPDGWDLSLHAEGRVWDEHLSWSLGMYLQKSF